MPRFEKLDIC